MRAALAVLGALVTVALVTVSVREEVARKARRDAEFAETMRSLEALAAHAEEVRAGTAALRAEVKAVRGQVADAGLLVNGRLSIRSDFVWGKPERLRVVEDGGVLHVYGGPDVVFHRVDGGW